MFNEYTQIYQFFVIQCNFIFLGVLRKKYIVFLTMPEQFIIGVIPLAVDTTKLSV